jgi:hypothetical protein
VNERGCGLVWWPSGHFGQSREGIAGMEQLAQISALVVGFKHGHFVLYTITYYEMCLLKTPTVFRQYYKRRLQDDHSRGPRLYGQPYGMHRGHLRESLPESLR